MAVPTTAGTGAETNAFGVVTDPAAHRDFARIGADALDDEVLANTPRPATASDVGAILAGIARQP